MKFNKSFTISILPLLVIWVISLMLPAFAERIIIRNGDFSSGNSGFSSHYTYKADQAGVNNELTGEGAYGVGTSAYNYHNAWLNGGDHTTGSGMMFIANGSSNTSSIVWQGEPSQDLIIGQTYDFSAWIMDVYNAGAHASLTFKADDEVIGTLTCSYYQTWTRLSGSFTATTVRPTLTLKNAQSDAYGNDFAVDDLNIYYEDSTIPPTEAVLSTSAASSISYSSATLGGNITSNGGDAITERGIVYSSTDIKPYIGDAGVTQNSNGSGSGSFNESIGSFAPGTTYYFQAYATNTQGTAYGGIESFQTDPAYFMAKSDGNWSNPAIWYISATSSTDPADYTTLANGTPTADNSYGIIINSNVTVDASVSVDQLTVASGYTLTINSGQILTVQNGSGDDLTVQGLLTNNGSLSCSASTSVVFNGNNQNVPSGTVPDLTISGTGTKTLSGNLTVTGNLIVETTLNLNGKSLDLQSTGVLNETTGSVTGSSGTITATRNLNAPSGENVAGLGAMITSAASLGNTTITRGHAAQSNGGSENSINRYYDISPSTNSGLNATLVFYYHDSELNAQTEGGLTLFRSTDGGSTWQDQGGVVNTSSNTITLNGIDAFSRWTGSSSTLTIKLKNFIASYENESIILRWQTAMESNVAGFFIERSTDETTWQRIADCQTNNELSAQGMFTAQPEYTFVDKSVISGESYYYRLGEISTTGATKIYAETFVETPAVPQTTVLTKIYPNPFNPQTTISYQLENESRVQLEVYDLLGRKVRTLFDGINKAGQYDVLWNGLNDQGQSVASGIYTVHLKADGHCQVRQISLLK